MKRDGMEATARWAPPFNWAVEYQGPIAGWKLLLWEPILWKPLLDTKTRRVRPTAAEFQ